MQQSEGILLKIKITRIQLRIIKKERGIQREYANLRGYKPIPDTFIENHNKQYAEAAGMPHVRIHDFRHSHASLLCNEGINIQEIARRLGHSDVSMTWNTYSHLYQKAEEKALEVLEKV